MPSQASDVDQFLDDLFMPVLDGNLDELSDARSLAASIKGGGERSGQGGHVECRNEEEVDHEVASITQSFTRARYEKKNLFFLIIICDADVAFALPRVKRRP